jgi:hypothetical protein
MKPKKCQLLFYLGYFRQTEKRFLLLYLYSKWSRYPAVLFDPQKPLKDVE